MIRKVYVFLLLLSILFCAARADDGLLSLTVLQTTDIHGNAGIGELNSGLPKIAAVIAAERKNSGGEILLIDCGDTAQGTYSATFDQGASMFTATNLIGYDVWVPGNHDFDYGIPVLVKHARSIKFNKLAANIRIDGNENLFAPWVLLHKNGLKIAVIGIVPEYLPQWIAQAQLQGLRQFDILDSIGKIMPDIMNAAPDIIVLAIHAGEFSSARLNEDNKRHSISEITVKYPQINLVLGGHSHQTVPGKKLYPNSWFVQAPPHAGGVAKTNIVYDKSKRRITKMTTVLLSASKAEDAPEIATVFEGIRKKAETGKKTVPARISEPLEPASNSGKAGLLSDFFCRALVEGTSAELAVHGTLSNYKAKPGNLTEFQIFLLAPYENYISILNLSPSEVKAIIREQKTLKSGDRKSFMNVYGIRYDWNSGNNRVGNLTLESTGEVWNDENRRISFALGSFAVSGAGGRFPVLKEIAESEKVGRIDLQLTVREAFRSFLMKNYPPEP